MFICPVTKKVSAPREGMHKVVVEVRPVTYTNYNQDGDLIESRGVETQTQGTEIVREIGCSAEGARILRERGEEVAITKGIRVRKQRSLAEELAELELSLED